MIRLSEKHVLCTGVLLLCVASSLRAELLLRLDAIHYGPGDTFNLAIGLDGTQAQEQPVDIYLAIISPDGRSVVFLSGNAGEPNVSPGQLTEPATWTPLARGLVLRDIGDVKPVPYLTLPIPAGLQTGDYRVAFAATRAGTLQVVESSFKVFRVLENSIRANLGSFTGEWNNNTFNASGPVTFNLREIAPGMLEGSLSFGGFAALSWDSETGTETRQVALADHSGLIDFQMEDELIDGTYSVTYSPDGAIEIEVTDIGFAGYFGVTASGERNGDSVDIDYQVTAGFGAAQGTVTGSRED